MLATHMEQTIGFKGTVSWQRFKSAQWKHGGARWLVLFLFPVGMTTYVWFTAVRLPAATWVLVCIVSAAFVPVMLAFNWLAWRRTYAKSPYLQQQLFGSVSRDRFVIEGVTGRTEMAWDQFVRVREGRDFLLLYQAPNLFNILAREFFESDDAWETARRFARREE